MTRFHDVTLELVRPGPAHNQLLSPLTTYMALCGDGEPVTFRMELEHQRFLNRLERLRYQTWGADGKIEPVAEGQRQAEVVDLGQDMARILGQIHSLNAQINRPFTRAPSEERNDMIHLRVILSGSELSLLPLEIAVAPQGFPGEGRKFVLQSNKPIVMTREVRRSRPLPVPWDRPIPPRILFISAQPDGLKVPAAQHVHALRAALAPWLSSKSDLSEVKAHLRILPDASIEDIYAKCASEHFTHIHVLAHGDYYDDAGERRFGVALCKHGTTSQKEVVCGQRLANALLAEQSSGSGRSQPTMVVLATCDAGNVGSVLVPGGSIAYELHTAGIPWVLASQLPLTVAGSVRLTELLYPRLLRGDDPREILYELRRQLFVGADRDHDWASIVAYATIPADFDESVASFFERQMRRVVEIGFKDLDDDRVPADAKALARRSIDQHLKLWLERVSHEPAGVLVGSNRRLRPTAREREQRVQIRMRRAECLGMHGSAHKRYALMSLKQAASSGSPQEAADHRRLALESLSEARRCYKAAMEDLDPHQWATYHWAATQYLSLTAIVSAPPEPDTYTATVRDAQRDLLSENDETRAWAHGSLAELAMLSAYHLKTDATGGTNDVEEHCHRLLDLAGRDSFAVFSTRRQFQRYIDHWPDREWAIIASIAVRALSQSSNVQVEMPPYA